MRLINAGAILLIAATLSLPPAIAERPLSDTITDEITGRGWQRRDAAAIAMAQELSFALHQANGSLDLRLNALGRYAGDPAMQLLISRHPQYLDFFLNLEDPAAFLKGIDSFSDDQHRRETLLEAMLANPNAAGYRQFERVVIRYGDALGHLADQPEFAALISTLIFAARDGATEDFDIWLHELLVGMPNEDIEAMTIFLAQAGGTLRREVLLSPRWELLTDQTAGDPVLRDLLLGHLRIWRHLEDARLIDVIRTQLHQDGHDKALLYLAFFLGTDQLLVAGAMPEDWQDPLSLNRLDWSMERLDEYPAAPAVEVSLHFRSDDRFWTFVMREGVEDRIPCLLRLESEQLDRIKKYFDQDARQLDGVCNHTLPDFLPGASLETLGRKMWHGTPVGIGDLGWAVADTVDIGWTALSLGAGKMMVPTAKVAFLRAHAKLGLKASASMAEGKTVVASAIRVEITEMNIASRASAATSPGLSRMLGVPTLALANRTRNLVEHAPPQLRDPVKELLEQASYAVFDKGIENMFTTEFIRCSSLPSLSVDDPICQVLFPPTNEDEVPP